LKLIKYSTYHPLLYDQVDGVIASILASNLIFRVLYPRPGQAKDYTIGICFFCNKHVSIRRKWNDWLAWNQYNASEWSDMSTCGLLFQWASTIKIQLSVLV